MKLAQFLAPLDPEWLVCKKNRQGRTWGLFVDFNPNSLAQGRELALSIGAAREWADLVDRAGVPEPLWEASFGAGETPETFGAK